MVKSVLDHVFVHHTYQQNQLQIWKAMENKTRFQIPTDQAQVLLGHTTSEHLCLHHG